MSLTPEDRNIGNYQLRIAGDIITDKSKLLLKLLDSYEL